MQKRRLMLLNKDRRAEALAELEAQDAERGREREVAENARRRQAATGIYRCLLEMKQPVQAAEAARVRLGMCETKEEQRQVIETSKSWFWPFSRFGSTQHTQPYDLWCFAVHLLLYKSTHACDSRR